MLKHYLLFLLFLLSPTLSFAQNYSDKAAEAEALKKREIQLKESQVNAPKQEKVDEGKKQNHSDLKQNSSNHSANFIACPLQQIETKVKTALPAGWWDTPQVGKLQNTQIMNIGGKQTLQCFYWAYDKSIPLMKLAPEGKTCSAVQGGFSCQ